MSVTGPSMIYRGGELANGVHPDDIIYKLDGGRPDVDFEIGEPEAVTTSVPFTVLSAERTVLDRIEHDYRVAHTRTHYRFSATRDGEAVEVAWSNTQPTRGRIGTDGLLRQIAAGGVVVEATKGDVTQRRAITLPTFPQIPAPVNNYTVRGVPGSLRLACEQAIDTRIAHATVDNAESLKHSFQHRETAGDDWELGYHPTHEIRWNPDRWFADVDVSWASPWNDRSPGHQAGAIITPKHAVLAAHYPLQVGDTMHCIQPDGTRLTRTVAVVTPHPDFTQADSNDPNYRRWDVKVVELDDDLPAAIDPVLLPPAAIDDFLPPGAGGHSINVPTVMIDQEDKCLVGEWVAPLRHTDLYRNVGAPREAPRLTLHETWESGDSGSPIGLLFDGRVMLTHVMRGGGGGQWDGVRLDMVLDFLASAVGTYELQFADLSSYTEFNT